MRAELVAVGDELLDGDVVNANAAWLGARLAAEGVAVSRSIVVGDDTATIAAVVAEGLARTGLVLTTGGLGPTQDDVTREALATVAGVALERDEFLAATLRRRLGAAGPQVTERNLRQADLPRGATPLPNPRGTAPGIALEVAGGLVVALPGPPHEMQAMVQDSVLGLLARRPGAGGVLVTRTLHTVGRWESAVAQALAPLLEELAAAGDAPTVAFLAAGGMTRVKLTARAPSRAAAVAALAPVEAAARVALGSAVFGVDDDSLEAVVLTELVAQRATVACAESLTGGLLSARLTAVPGASRAVRGGVVVYQTETKASVLGVQRTTLAGAGAVSAPAAAEMAAGVRRRFAADYGLALTGVAGPERQEDKPAGTVFLALAGPHGLAEAGLSLVGDREQVRSSAVVAALDLLRRTLAGQR